MYDRYNAGTCDLSDTYVCMYVCMYVCVYARPVRPADDCIQCQASHECVYYNCYVEIPLPWRRHCLCTHVKHRNLIMPTPAIIATHTSIN